jgi:hypothetical protein
MVGVNEGLISSVEAPFGNDSKSSNRSFIRFYFVLKAELNKVVLDEKVQNMEWMIMLI